MEQVAPAFLIGVFILATVFILFLFFILIRIFTRAFTFIDRKAGKYDIDKEPVVGLKKEEKK